MAANVAGRRRACETETIGSIGIMRRLSPPQQAASVGRMPAADGREAPPRPGHIDYP